MYKRHKRSAIILFVAMLVISFFVPLHYSKIAEVGITIISITLAVYISAATSLLGSSFSRSLKRLKDKENPTKSMLGVLSEYLKWAGIYSVVTIVISSVYLIWPGIASVKGNLLKFYLLASRLFSAFACSMFSINILFMSITMHFLVVSLNNAAVQPDE